jgi:hypothetical protein
MRLDTTRKKTSIGESLIYWRIRLWSGQRNSMSTSLKYGFRPDKIRQQTQIINSLSTQWLRECMYRDGGKNGSERGSCRTSRFGLFNFWTRYDIPSSAGGRGYTRKLRQRELEDGQGMREGTVPGSKILLVPSHA